MDVVSVSLIVPMLNERRALPELLGALRAQQLKPAEIIFVDAGSSDSSPELVTDWWKSEQWPQTRCEVVRFPGAFPGAARNRGIERSTQDWIAFLDCGIVPRPNWLAALVSCAATAGAEAVLGACEFNGAGALSRALCALSYGAGTRWFVLPASLFRKTLIQSVGGFDVRVRAGEDREWLRRVRAAASIVDCGAARVAYGKFPETLRGAATKWYLYERHLIRSGHGQSHLVAVGSAAAGIAVIVAASPALLAWIAFAYIALRGVADPVRRSATRLWWGSDPLALAVAPAAAVAIDGARCLGVLHGALERLVRVERE